MLSDVLLKCMRKLGSFLQKTYQERVSRPPVLDDRTVFYVCKRLIAREYGVRGGENLEPRYYKEKRLFIAARSSLWAQEFRLVRTAFVALLNDELGQEAVVEIKIESAWK